MPNILGRQVIGTGMRSCPDGVTLVIVGFDADRSGRHTRAELQAIYENEAVGQPILIVEFDDNGNLARVFIDLNKDGHVDRVLTTDEATNPCVDSGHRGKS